MNAPSVDVKDMLLADSSLDLTFATDLFVNREPTHPNRTVTIFDVFGGWPQLTLDPTEEYYYHSVQIRIRSDDANQASQLTHNIMTLLHGRHHEVWNGALYTVIYCANGPALLDWDDNNRARFIINFNLQRRPELESSAL